MADELTHPANMGKGITVAGSSALQTMLEAAAARSQAEQIMRQSDETVRANWDTLRPELLAMLKGLPIWGFVQSSVVNHDEIDQSAVEWKTYDEAVTLADSMHQDYMPCSRVYCILEPMPEPPKLGPKSGSRRDPR